jgi:uncharacterized protein (TIRG00374 family)
MRAVMWLLALAGVVVTVFVVADVRATGASLRSFDWWQLPAVIALTLCNYALRWVKWDWYLRRMGMREGMHTVDSALLFTSGLAMAVTPGKAGEVSKSFLLRRLNGTPVSASAPVVLAERFTDGLAMLLLAAIGLAVYPAIRPVFALLAVLALAAIVVVRHGALLERGLALAAAAPVARRFRAELEAVRASTRSLFAWPLLELTTALSVVSWFGECAAFAFVLAALGEPLSGETLLLATFIFAASTLVGLVSLLPGGLGASEVSSAGLLVLLVPMDAGPAAAATLVIRVCTLWFGVAIGFVALALMLRRLARPSGAARAAALEGGAER